MKDGLLSRLEAEAPNMPRILQRVANYIRENADLAMRQTVEDVAAGAACSEGTVIRLCKDLGFSGFQELKLALAVDSAKQPSKSEKSRGRGIVERLIETTLEAVSATRHLAREQDLVQAANLLLNAKRIQVFGVGASAHVAALVEYKLARFGLPARAISDTHMGLMLAALLEKGDALIAVSSSGSTIDVVKIAEAAKSRGAAVVAMTNRPRSRLSKISTCVLGAATPEAPLSGGSITSKVTQLLLLDMLTAVMLERRPALAKAVKATAQATVHSSY
jgi:DNA-binding MurR/RpiR family transcriptional regulator